MRGEGLKRGFTVFGFLPWTIQLCLRSVDKVCSKLEAFFRNQPNSINDATLWDELPQTAVFFQKI